MSVVLPPLPSLHSSAWPALETVAQRRAALDIYIETFNTNAVKLASQLRSGSMGVDAWQLAMRSELTSLHVNALVLSYGGDSSAISFAEWGRLGGHLRVQYRYLHNYAEKVQQNLLGVLMQQNKVYSEKYLQWRSKLYGGNSRASFYRGLSVGLLEQVPGDGKTICKSNCTCELRFEEGDQPGLLPIFCVGELLEELGKDFGVDAVVNDVNSVGIDGKCAADILPGTFTDGHYVFQASGNLTLHSQEVMPATDQQLMFPVFGVGQRDLAIPGDRVMNGGQKGQLLLDARGTPAQALIVVNQIVTVAILAQVCGHPAAISIRFRESAGGHRQPFEGVGPGT